MTSAQEKLNEIQQHSRSILSNNNLFNTALIEKISEATGIDKSAFDSSVEDCEPNFNFLIKFITLASEVEAFIDNYNNDEVEEDINDFGSYLNHSMFALLFHEANDPLAIYESNETKKMAMECINAFCSISQIAPSIAQSMFNTFATCRNLTYQLYEAEVQGNEPPPIKADTIQNFYDGLEKVSGNELLQKLMTDTFCYVLSAVGKLIQIGTKKPVHEQIEIQFVVAEDATPPTLIEAFKKKYRLYVGSYGNLLQSLSGAVDSPVFELADWRKGMLALQLDNDVLVAQNPLERGSPLLFIVAKNFKPYLDEKGAQVEVFSFPIL